MKTRALFALAAFALAFGCTLRAGDLPWQDDYDKALVDAKTAHKLVLLDFSATWCGPCRMMANTTFADASVQKMLAPYELVRIDIDRQPALASQYKVDAIPTCVLLNPFGELVDRRTGYANADQFSQWVQASAKLPIATAKESKSAKLERGVKQLGESLTVESIRQNGPEACDKSVMDLLAIYCAQGASGSKLVEDELRDFVEQDPDLAAPYLNEPRLAVRILFATLFAAANPRIDFPFDPWAPAPERAKQADAWARRVQARYN